MPRSAFSLRLFIAALSVALLPSVVCAQPIRRKMETITWVKGTVRDVDGKPIAGAKVFARATYDSGIRMNGLLRTTVSDTEGKYAITGENHRSHFSATLIASIGGRPPAISWFSLPEEREFDAFGVEIQQPPLTAPEVDLIIPGAGGQLDISVLKEGRPLPGANVRLRLKGADPFDNWGLESSTDEHRALYAICRPTVQTTGDGLARFQNLLPGFYSVLAFEVNPAGDMTSALALTEYRPWYPFSDPPIIGEMRHVAVRAGQTAAHKIAVFRPGCKVKFEILKGGADWIKAEQLLPRAFRADGHYDSGPTFIGQQWTDTYRFETPGIKQLSFIKYEVNSQSYSSSPFTSADGAIASSPRLSQSYPVTLVADENWGSAIRIKIEDQDGHPLAGSAVFHGKKEGYYFFDSKSRDVTDQGLLINGLQPMGGRVSGRAAGVSTILPNKDMVRMPTDEELVGRAEIPAQWVTLGYKEHREVTLRYEKVGYLRGRLMPAPGKTPKDYSLVLGRSDYQRGAGISYQENTGEFLAGPYVAEHATIGVRSVISQIPILTKAFAVQAGAVAKIELQAPEGSDTFPQWLRAYRGQIYMADGKTPAHMAALARYLPTDRAWGAGVTDASGAICPHGMWAPFDEDAADKPGTPREPVLIVWQPGQCGATIVTPPDRPDQPVNVNLPPPIALRGRVRVAGDGDTIDNGIITVRAQYEGRGLLDDLLSVETTAGADGNFELAGLTPGQYHVQAALDGIWLSSSIAVTASDQPLQPIELAIAPPGGPVLVRVTGNTKPLDQLIVSRPPGPLANRLWPKGFSPDGAGVIRIPALEAGRHFIRLSDVERAVDVLPLSQTKGLPAEIELPLAQ